MLGLADPRTAFSGNAGTTNVYRLAGRFWAAAVLLLDVGRAAAFAAFGERVLPPDAVPWVAFALVAGNRYPLFHRFRGGKGVAAFLGFTLPLAPFATVVSCGLWVVIHRMVRLPFIASFGMVSLLAIGLLLRYHPFPWAVAGILATALSVAANHRTNWRRWRRTQGTTAGGENPLHPPSP